MDFKLIKCSTTHFTFLILLARSKKLDINSGATYLPIAIESVKFYVLGLLDTDKQFQLCTISSRKSVNRMNRRSES
jgi:hypothetical protein